MKHIRLGPVGHHSPIRFCQLSGLCAIPPARTDLGQMEPKVMD